MRILVVDDEESIRELLTVQLEKNGYEVLVAEDGLEALDKAPEADLILLDIMMPKLDGFEVCRQLKGDKKLTAIPVIMLTARADEIDRVLGLELGADDYLSKPFSVRELLARIKAVLRRVNNGVLLDEQVLKIGSLTMNFLSYQASVKDELLPLTPKEFELLKLLVTNPGKAFSRDELLERVWGYEYYGDTRTVDVHIRHLRAKLAADEKLVNGIETVRSIGYRFIQ